MKNLTAKPEKQKKTNPNAQRNTLMPPPYNLGRAEVLFNTPWLANHGKKKQITNLSDFNYKKHQPKSV